MIRALPTDGILVAFPARPCPDGCNPSQPDGHGSGTWLACAYAIAQGHQVIVHPFQSDMTLPLWITKQYVQLNLFE